LPRWSLPAQKCHHFLSSNKNVIGHVLET
jgi:hypothetical protein